MRRAVPSDPKKIVKGRQGTKMKLEDVIRMTRRQTEARRAGRVPQMELFAEHAMEDEEDMGALRLLILQAAMKEKRILESQG